jgi:hypothetical protein
MRARAAFASHFFTGDQTRQRNRPESPHRFLELEDNFIHRAVDRHLALVVENDLDQAGPIFADYPHQLRVDGHFPVRRRILQKTHLETHWPSSSFAPSIPREIGRLGGSGLGALRSEEGLRDATNRQTGPSRTGPRQGVLGPLHHEAGSFVGNEKIAHFIEDERSISRMFRAFAA